MATITTVIMSSTKVNPRGLRHTGVMCIAMFVSLMPLSQLNPGFAADGDVRWQRDLHRLHRWLAGGGRDDGLADQPRGAFLGIDHGQSAGLVRLQAHHICIVVVV